MRIQLAAYIYAQIILKKFNKKKLDWCSRHYFSVLLGTLLLTDADYIRIIKWKVTKNKKYKKLLIKVGTKEKDMKET